jgi:hypothetical protein
MNGRRDFIPQFKKDGTPRKGYSNWGEKFDNIKMRQENSEYELTHGKTFFKGEYYTLNCVHCEGNHCKKIYMKNQIHYAKYECCQCYRNLQWISKPKRYV